MNRLIASVSVVVLALTASVAIAAVGRTPGTFSVAPTGAATYSIPIWVPPGPRGVQPNLAITYNSHAGSSTLGPGWSISGLSAITRCEKNLAQDPLGSPNGVTLTYDDVFCMDGKRLRLYGNTLAYGQPGSQYQTEIADFSLVTANGIQGNGPASFTVKAKNGWTYDYGNGGNSQVLAYGTSTVSIWLLRQVTDRSGNRMIVSYLEPDANRVGTTAPDEISWTAESYNSDTFNYKVKFTYGANNTQGATSGYVGGTPVRTDDLLENISVSSFGTTKKKYVFVYETSPTTGGKRLWKIKECADAAEADCLTTPTTIGWQDGQAGVPGAGTGSYSYPFQERVQYGVRLFDANGDGYPDRFYRDGSPCTWYVAFGSAAGFGAGQSTGAPCVAMGPATEGIGDVLGNGRAGILTSNGVYYWWTESGFTSASTGIAVPSPSIPILADGNGDGRVDVFYMVFTPGEDSGPGTVPNPGSAALYMRASTGTGSSPSFGDPVVVGGAGGVYGALLSPTATSLPFLDINGDGREDLLMTVSTLAGCDPLIQCSFETSWVALVSQSNGTYTGLGIGSATLYSATIPTFVNWNNDACTDIVYANEVLISGCNGTTTTYVPINSLNGIGALDWDGDGRSDLLVNTGSTVGVRLSTGTDISPTVINTGISFSNAFNSTCGAVYTIDVDGDGLDDLACYGGAGSGTVTYYRHNAPDTMPNLVTSITDGYGLVVRPSYVALSRAVATGVYDATRDATWPYKDFNGPFYVVSSYSGTDATGIVDGAHDYNVQYRYSRGWMHNLGRGFAGFDSVRAIDSRDSLQAYRYFWKDFPYTGMLRQEEVFQSDGTTAISQTINTRATAAQTYIDQAFGQERYLPKVTSSIRKHWEAGGPKNGQLITTVSTDFTIDVYGNVTYVAETITDNDPTSPYSNSSWTSTTSTSISPDTNTWCLDAPVGIQVTRTAPGVIGFITRTATFVPDYANCRVTRKTTEPNSGTYSVQQDFGYDNFGNINSVTTTAAGVPARVSTINWGATGQIPATSTNALNQTTTYDYDFGRGLLTSVTDPNSVVVSFEYDTFGRQVRQNRPDGTATTWSFEACAPNCVNSANILSVTETVLNVGGSTQTDSVAYLDRFDRPLTKRTRLLNGGYDRVDVQYDEFGRVAARAAPCSWTSCTYYWTTFTYDLLGRTTQIQRPVSAALSGTLQTTTIEYAGRTTTTTDPQGKHSVNVTSAVGTLLRTQDHDGYYQSFLNDAFGSLLSVTDSTASTLFSATYDYGVGAFQRTTNDTDLGPRTYNYNALGELISYSDNNGNSFGVSYDALSRPLVRTEPGLSTSFIYGSNAASHNIGQLESVSATSSEGTYSEAFTYDGWGRQASRTITIPSDSPAAYTYEGTYDSSTGLPDTLTYPADANGDRLKLQYAYANGILQSVSNYNSPGSVFWTANETNVAGQVTQETLGNGVVINRTFDAVTGWMSTLQSGLGGGTALQNESYLYDLVGNVGQRQNNNVGLTENFYYDNLHRLDHSTLGGTTNLVLTYDATGNIQTRSTVAGGATWTYGTSRRHAVTQAGSSAYTYAYDGNGNVINRNGNSITWTSFDHPSVINGPGGESIAFAYNHEHLRWRVIYNGAAGVETTLMIGGMLEKVLTAGAVDYRHFIKVGGSTVAVFSRTGAGVVTVRYLLADHQGSVAGILNADGTAYVKESYTAFGERRNQCTWDGPPTQGTKDKIAAVTRHGYTWHTALADWGLNDMNGRIQDAVTGRFLSPDPYVPNPANTQSFNRYSYVLNNPLTFVDPTGFAEDMVTMTISGSQWSPCLAFINCFNQGFAGAAVMDPGQQQQALQALQASSAAAEQAAENGMQQVVVTGKILSDKPRPKPQGGQSQGTLAASAVPIGIPWGSIPWGRIGGLGLRGLLAQAAAAGTGALLMLTPSTTATQDDDSGRDFYHGTSTFLGGPLDATAAAANSNGFGSAPGFYLATNPDTAAHFAYVAAEQSGQAPMIVRYHIYNSALQGLQGAGATLGPVPGGPTRYTSFPGQQLFVPITAFPAFNGYMLSGRIFVSGPVPAP